MSLRPYQYNIQVLGGVTVTPGVRPHQFNIQVLGGIAPVAYNYVSTGGLTLGDTSNVKTNIGYVSTGGLTLSGTSVVKPDIGHIATGGLILNGESPSALGFENNYGHVSAGGLILSGESVITSNYGYIGSGQLTLSGDSDASFDDLFNFHFYSQHFRNQHFGSQHFAFVDNYNYPASGGLALGGESIISLEGAVGYNYVPSGGLILSGDSTEIYINNYDYFTSGGLVLGGQSTASFEIAVNYNYVALGGLILSGDSTEIYINNYDYFTSGGLVLSGQSIASFEVAVNYSYVASGELTLDGQSVITSNYSYITSNAGLILQGESVVSIEYHIDGEVLLDVFISSEVSSAFIKSEEFTWNVVQSIELDLGFSWDVGNEKLYWYTVEGICKVDSGCATTGIPLGSKGRIFSRTVAARSLTDLCFKLKTLYLNYPVDWPITKILRYKKPVYLDDVDYVDNLNSYNLLENNDLVRTTTDFVDTISNYEVINTTMYPDKFTLILPDSRKIVKNFESGILKSVDIIDVNGLTKNYRENSVATITAVPSSLMSINYKIEQQIKSLSLDDNSGVLQQYCHIPECLAFCINEDLLIEIGCTTQFTDAFYDYVAEGNLNFSGRSLVSDSNLISFNGGIVLSGSALYTKNSFSYTPSGRLILGSSPLVVFAAWNYLPLNYNLVLSGLSPTTAENLNYKPVGTIVLSGNILFKSSYRFLIKNPILSIAGNSICNYKRAFEQSASGLLTLGSSFNCKCSNYKYSSGEGLHLGGNFLIKSNRRNYVVNSGLILSGFHLLGHKYLGNGSLILGNDSFSIVKNKVIASGTLVLGSTALISSTNFNYVPTGGLVLNGSFETNIFNDLDLMIDIGSNVNLLTFEPILPEAYDDTTAESFTYDNGVVINYDCGCGSIPVKLYLNNNITTSGLLKSYLNRNNLSLSDDIELTYNVIGKSWRHNAYLNSVDNSEKWIIIYEWTCDELDSVNVWNFSISISRQLNGNKKNSKLMFLFDKTDPCNNEKIEFNFNFNTNIKNIVSPNGLNVLKYIVKDDIGLFKDKDWLNTSLLKIQISESQNTSSIVKKDIFSIFPN